MAEKTGTSERTISRRISELSQFIRIETENKGTIKEKRKLYLKGSANIDHPPSQICPPPLDKFVVHNNTSNNNINILSFSTEEIYNYYILAIKRVGKYEMKYNKKALSLERIEKAIKQEQKKNKKSLDKQYIINIIETYIRNNRENIQNGYCKMCQYFF
jgi:hypothetical protein